MKNNKGFISISVVYSFFLVFLITLLFIVNSFVSNRTILRNVKDDIKENVDIKISESPEIASFSDYSGNLGIGYTIENASIDSSTKIIEGISDEEGNAVYLAVDNVDNSFRYSGSDPKNYVCFGNDDDPCNSDFLYRIIGFFDDDQDGNYNMKLIQAEWYCSG